jgi:FAD/FMN-containing dehydrogenase
VITEATLRLYALPQEMISLSLGIPDGLGALRNRIASVLDGPGIPFCVELVNAALAERIGLSREPQLLVKIGGNSAGVAAQRAAMNALGGARIFKSEVWDSLRTVDGSATSVVRLSTLPGKTAELWIGARDALRDVPNALMHSTPSLGVVRCVLPTVSIDLMQKLSALTSSVVYERMPAEQWNVLSSTVVGDRISQGIKKAFDPSNILNPGILGPIV